MNQPPTLAQLMDAWEGFVLGVLPMWRKLARISIGLPKHEAVKCRSVLANVLYLKAPAFMNGQLRVRDAYGIDVFIFGGANALFELRRAVDAALRRQVGRCELADDDHENKLRGYPTPAPWLTIVRLDSEEELEIDVVGGGRPVQRQIEVPVLAGVDRDLW